MNAIMRNFYQCPKRDSVYARWIVLVLLNAAFPFILSLELIDNVSIFSGIMLAIISFIVIYAELELWLSLNHYQPLAKQLKLGALIKIGTVFLPFIDLITGVLALEVSSLLTGVRLDTTSQYTSTHDSISSNYLNIPELLASYVTTMIDGFLLSIIVGVLIMVIRGFIWLKKQYKQQNHTESV